MRAIIFALLFVIAGCSSEPAIETAGSQGMAGGDGKMHPGTGSNAPGGF